MTNIKTLLHTWAELLALPKPKVESSKILESSFYERRGRSHVIHVRMTAGATELAFHELGHFFLDVHYGNLLPEKGFLRLFGDLEEAYDSPLLDVPGVRHLPPRYEGFVSRYAEVHPEEDWAETFAVVMGFIHRNEDLELTDDALLDRKLLFAEKAINKAIKKSGR